MSNRRLVPAVIACALLFPLGCAPTASGPSADDASELGVQSAALSTPTVDACKSADPDGIYYVPVGPIAEHRMNTEGAAYYYREGCTFGLFDVKMATYSNLGTEQVPGPGFVHWGSDADDLPGSASFGGRLPVVAEDCNRLVVETRLYRRLSNEAAFTRVYYEKRTHAWQSNQCVSTIATSSGVRPERLDNTSGSGWDTWRIAVRVKERTSGQQARGAVFPPPPQ